MSWAANNDNNNNIDNNDNSSTSTSTSTHKRYRHDIFIHRSACTPRRRPEIQCQFAAALDGAADMSAAQVFS